MQITADDQPEDLAAEVEQLRRKIAEMHELLDARDGEIVGLKYLLNQLPRRRLAMALPAGNA